jgi:Phage integrase, N-terminal SAM-like domain
MTPGDLGPYVHGFFLDYLGTQKDLRPSSIRAYRDGFRLFLTFVADDRRCAVSRVRLDDLTVERAQRFLHFLEHERHNHIRTRNHRRAVLVSFFESRAVTEFLLPMFPPGISGVHPPRSCRQCRRLDEDETTTTLILAASSRRVSLRVITINSSNVGRRPPRLPGQHQLPLRFTHRRLLVHFLLFRFRRHSRHFHGHTLKTFHE